ncbi:prostate and testis expressed protein 14 [Phodopus roborovskii]|uniref:prostate and testis expressed protein 14 n=1 Tax=Phodopus roborovskii TaxID=109678 RepID=UPI0021E4EDD7|nr:prostate and testis expressed protein 14 [Phodopus roborovskii]
MNLAAKIGTLLIVTLSLLISVEAVLCVKCEFVNSSKICETQSRYCATKKGQKCLLWVATSGESLSYGAQACWEHCSNVTTMKGSLKMQLTCCDSHSLCNKL